MKKTHFILTLIMLFAFANTGKLWSQTIVSADIQSSTTWTLMQSPYLVSDSVAIDSGVTLTIEPGVEVRFEDQVVFEVKGELEALGNPTDSITFRSESGSWQGIEIAPVNGSQARFAYCNLREAEAAISAQGATGNDRLELSHSRISQCNSGLESIPDQLFEINDCSFEDNFYGIYQSNLTLAACNFNRNAISIFGSVLEMDSCSLSKSSLSAIEGGSGSVKRSSFFYNTIALSGFGNTVSDSIYDCEIILNDTGVVLASPFPQYFANNICGNGVGVRVATAANADLTDNCWCSLDSVTIANQILDGNDLPGTGFVNYTPFDSCDYPGTVWPGDANNDGIANISDLLSIGVAFGAQGATRPNVTQFWAAQTGVPWGLTFADGTDFIHADCNGSGNVDLNDTLAILGNFGLTHPKNANVAFNGNANLCISYPQTAMPGDTFTVDLSFGGNPGLPVEAYGFAITLGYDRSIIDSTRLRTELNNSFLGAASQPDLVDLQVSRDQFHWAITRTNHRDTTFLGRIGGMEMIMIDDLARVIPINITVDDVVLVDSSGARIAVNLNNCPPANAQRLTVQTYPNPSDQMVTIDWNDLEAEQVEVYSASGQLQALWEAPEGRSLDYDVQGLNPGIYLIRVKVPNGTLSRKIMISR